MAKQRIVYGVGISDADYHVIKIALEQTDVRIRDGLILHSSNILMGC